MSRPEAAIIIPHYNDVVRLARCLDALAASDTDRAEVVVVDNGSTQPLDAIQAAHPGFRFVIEATRGAAAARNRGVAETVAPLLLFIDSDCVPAPDWLATALSVADRADLIGGRVEVFDETPPPRTGAQAFETVFAFNFKRYIEVLGFSGAGNLVTRRDVFEAVGPFRNGLSEDKEWTMRARSMGYSLVYEPALRVSHPTRSDWKALRAKWLRVTREMYALNGTQAVARTRWALRALAMPASIIVHGPRILRHPALGPGERLKALGTLVRVRMLRCRWMLQQAAGGEI